MSESIVLVGLICICHCKCLTSVKIQNFDLYCHFRLNSKRVIHQISKILKITQQQLKDSYRNGERSQGDCT